MKDGIYHNISMPEYRSIKALNQSGFQSLQKSNFHFNYNLKKESAKISRALAIGIALHLRVFQPDLYYRDIKTHPLKSPRIYEINSRAILYLHPDDLIMIETIYDSLMKHSLTSKILASGIPELTIIWTDPDYGIKCKGKIDWLCHDLKTIFDLKTCPDASYTGFARSAKRFNYFRQAAFYKQGLEILGGENYAFNFVCIEKIAPFAKEQISIYNCPELELIQANLEIDEIKLKYKTYIEHNNHSGYPIEVIDLHLP